MTLLTLYTPFHMSFRIEQKVIRKYLRDRNILQRIVREKDMDYWVIKLFIPCNLQTDKSESPSPSPSPSPRVFLLKVHTNLSQIYASFIVVHLSQLEVTRHLITGFNMPKTQMGAPIGHL